MKKCSQCAEMVQSDALICRFCSHKFEKPSTSKPESKSIGCITIVAVIIVIAIVGGREDTKTALKTQTNVPTGSAMTMEQADRIVTEEELVKARLRDPQSAQFRHMNGGCGYVNSKNGFGGMSGDRRFIVGLNNKAVFREDNPHAFDIVWKGHCVEGKTP